MGETSKVIAIGKCVPVHIAQHVIKKAIKYSTGVESLVQQQFVHGHWMGVGVTIFDEPSQQLVSAEQVELMLNPDLSNEAFHKLYRKLSIPNQLTPFFGLQICFFGYFGSVVVANMQVECCNQHERSIKMFFNLRFIRFYSNNTVIVERPA